MTTITVTIPPEVENFVRASALARGESEEEFVRHHLEDVAARYWALRDQIQEAEESLQQGLGIPAEEVFARLHARAAKLQF